MGNVLIDAARDVLFTADLWNASDDRSVSRSAIDNRTTGINATQTWQYIFNNGPSSLFKGYSWSLDTFVDFTWNDLTRLSITLIILLVVEVCSRPAAWGHAPMQPSARSCWPHAAALMCQTPQPHPKRCRPWLCS